MGTVLLLSKSTWQWKFDGIQSSHKKAQCENFSSAFKSATVSTTPGAGREGELQSALCWDEEQRVRCLPQTAKLISQSSSAKQRWFKVQWVWAMVKTVRNHQDNKDDLVQARPDSLSKISTCRGSAPGQGNCSAKRLNSSQGLQPFLQRGCTGAGSWICFAL